METSIVKFKCIGYDGKTFTLKENIEHPVYEDEKFLFNDMEFNISKHSKIIDYLDDLDKKYIMDKYDIYIILDYSIYEKKEKISKKQQFLNLVDAINADETIKLDIIACYIKQYEHVKKLSVQKQLDICIESASIGYLTVINMHKMLDEATEITKKEIKFGGDKQGQSFEKVLKENYRKTEQSHKKISS